MSIKPRPIQEVPEETKRVAQATFPKGNIYMWRRDELGELYTDEQFVELFSTQGQPAEAPGRLALVNRLELVDETMRRALNQLANAEPDRLRTVAQPEWFSRYSQRLDSLRLPKDQTKREQLIESVFLKCHSEERSDEESPPAGLKSHQPGDSSLPLVAQSDIVGRFCHQIRFKKHVLNRSVQTGPICALPSKPPQLRRSCNRSKGWKFCGKSGSSNVKFKPSLCRACPSRELCARSQRGSRSLVLQPQAHHEALQQARQAQETSEFWKNYAKRSGIEGTISQAVRVCDLRRSRYIGLAKTRLQMMATAAAINLHRLFDWLSELLRAATRTSSFATLAPDPSLLAASWRF